MIAVECLQQQLEDQKNGLGAEQGKLPEELMKHIVELSESLTVDMESFTWMLLRNPDRLKLTLQVRDMGAACDELLAATLYVLQTGLVVVSQYGHAPWIADALTSLSARTRLTRAQLCEFSCSLLPTGRECSAGSPAPQPAVNPAR